VQMEQRDMSIVYPEYADEVPLAELTRLREENKASVGLRQRLALAEEIAASLHKQCEAKDAEIARLKARLFPLDCPPADQERDHLAEQCATLGKENASFSTENERLRAKLDRAKEALKPFAKHGEFIDQEFADHSNDTVAAGLPENPITLGDFRRARAILSELAADAPAQPKISDDVRALLDEAIAALETIGRQIADGNTGLATKTTYDTLTKLRAARNG
jgi:DNA repair exonuclease SbcCD ATPase subunit